VRLRALAVELMAVPAFDCDGCPGSCRFYGIDGCPRFILAQGPTTRTPKAEVRSPCDQPFAYQDQDSLASLQYRHGEAAAQKVARKVFGRERTLLS
jgi:hypothetical protein